MLIGRVEYKNKIITALYDPKEKKIFEIYSSINDVLRKIDVEIDVSSEGISVEEIVFLIPVIPSKIICLGRNYLEHARELGNEVPEEPILFFKPPSCLIPHKGKVKYPSFSKEVHYEGELALIIKQKIKNITEQEINRNPEKYFGYTSFIDMTARDIQKKDELWTRAKGFDTSGPIGPWININPLPERLKIITKLNDEIKQESDISKMIFSPSKIIEYISKIMTLEICDIISTGTPEGVGKVEIGDKVRLEIETLEALEITIQD